MKRNTGLFREKICITASSQDFAHRAPISFVIRRGTMIMAIVIVVLVFALCAYTAVDAMLTVKELTGTTEALKQTLEEQSGELEQYAQRISDLQEAQQAIGQSFDMPAADGGLTEDDGGEEAGAVSGEELETVLVRQELDAHSGSVNGSVTLLDWFEGGSELFARGTQVVVIDVETGLSFHAYRFGGWYHADCSPLTSADTEVMRQLYPEGWSWDRHAIWVKIGETYVAASMHGMPHETDPVPDDGFGGHFCIHLFHSMVHETNAECARHQAMVIKAYRSADILEEYLETHIYE